MTAPDRTSIVSGAEERRGAMALALQEALTVTVRFRGWGQAAADAASFRARIKQLLATADDDMRHQGYNPNDIRLAIYAVTVFIDESVLNSQLPMFPDWPRQPLQEEIFGGHTGGELFFENLRQLLYREDAEEVADLLEVHQLCMLLGFKGRYSMADPGELGAVIRAVGDKVSRIRGSGGLSPSWSVPANETIPVARDPWIRPLLIGAAGAAIAALVLWVVMLLALHSGLGDLRSLLLSSGA
jgi:type VI secretion system protein ImpK